jgi:hypothetical protein
MINALQSALAAVERKQHDLVGKLVRHADCPNEFFFVEAFEGEYRSIYGTFYDRVWVRGVDRYADQPFPARGDQLEVVTRH